MTSESALLFGGPAHGRRVEVPLDLGGILRWAHPAQVSVSSAPVDTPLRAPYDETLYRRERYAFPFRPPTDFVPKLEETGWRYDRQRPYEARWWTIRLYGTEDVHAAVRGECERLNKAADAAGGEALLADPLACLRALPSETRYFFARRRVFWRWLRGESLDDVPFVILRSGDVPSWGTL